MTVGFAIKVLVEVAVTLLIVYGIICEEKLIEFENELWKVIKFCWKKYVKNNKKNKERFS